MNQALFKSLLATSIFTVFIFLTSLGQQITGKDFYNVVGNVKLIEEKSYNAIKNNNEWIRNPEDSINQMNTIIFNSIGMPFLSNDFSIDAKFNNLVLAISLYAKFPHQSIFDYRDGKIFKIYEFDYGASTPLYTTTNFLKVENGFKIIQSSDTHYFEDTSSPKKIKYEWTKNRITKVINENGSFSENVYDEKGNQIKQIQVSKTGQIGKTDVFDYLSFDSKGNWTKRVLHSNDPSDKVAYIYERKITYY